MAPSTTTLPPRSTPIPPTSPIQRFYAESVVFVTGGTGFLGRILIEKLLRSCPDISTLYVLVRAKKGKNVHDRIEELFDDPIFEWLRTERPKFRHKVVGVAGDCSLKDLGLNMQDRQMVLNETNIVFHMAATVRFDEKLKFAVSVNVKSAQEVVKLCKEMPHLKSAVHVSTAYSHCLNNYIKESFYPPPMDHQNMLLLSDALPEKLLDKITPTLLGEWPNTYVFTKAIAEDVIKKEAEGLPIGVFRPAIITSTYKEPIKAWVNNLYGPSGVVAGAAVGLIKTVNGDKNAKTNIIPVDMCANALITVCYDVGVKYKKAKENGADFETEIYHYESNGACPLTWEEYTNLAAKYGVDQPSMKAVWYYSLQVVKSPVVFRFLAFFLHILPALVIDAMLVAVGRTPSMMKIYQKVHHSLNVISYFACRQWTYESQNVRKICDNMTKDDQETFFCDLRKLNWDDYFRTYVRGIRIYLLKDPMETLEAAKIRWNRLYWLHQCTKLLLVVLGLRLVWSVIFNIW